MRHGIVWSAVEAGSSALCALISAFAVARLIGPAELGIGAAAVAAHVLFWVAVNALFADALVQRASLDDDTRDSAVWASTLIGTGAAVAQAATGWLLAWSLDDARLIPMSLLLAAPLPFVGMAGAVQGVLTRARRYRALAVRALSGQAAGAALGIVLALHHAGAWAVVAQQTVVSLVSALVLIGVAGWRPRLVCRWSAVRDLLRIGLPLTASTLTQIGRYRLFALLIGGTAGAAALGQIHMAFRLTDAVRDIAFTALWRLMLPVLSEHQHDRDALLVHVDRLLAISAWVMLPVCGGLILTLEPLTALLLGPAWREAGAAARPLIGLMALLAMMFPSGVALIAVGQARHTLHANLLGLAAMAACVVLFRPATPWAAAMLWCVAQGFVSPYSLWRNGQALETGPLRPLRAALPALAATAAGVIAALALDRGAEWENLLWRGLVFTAVAGTIFASLFWRSGFWRSGSPSRPRRMA